MLRSCLNCNKQFSIWPSRIKLGGGKFCTRDCWNNSVNSSQKVNCLRCNEEFIVQTSQLKCGRGKYCSRRCVVESQTKKVKRRCLYCGHWFKVKPVVVKRGSGKFCSRPCSNKGASRRPTNKIERICLECGKHFQAWPRDIRRKKAKYCSRQCTGKGIWRNEEFCKRMSEAHRGYLGYWTGKKRLGIGEKVAKKLKGRKMNLTKEQREKRSVNGKRYGFQQGHKHSSEVIEKLREARLKQNMPKKYTSIEKKIYELLESNSIPFEPQRIVKGVCIADAFIPPNKVVFCDGNYWHTLPSYEERDSRINNLLEEKGYVVIRLWEHEINQNINFCLERIKNG